MSKNSRVGQKWTSKEIEFLKANYFKFPLCKLAETLHRNYRGIATRINKLGLYSEIIKNIKPLENLTETEKAYTAGLIDGEGNIGFSIVYRNNRFIHASPKVSIANTNEEIIKWIASKVNWGRWRFKFIYSRQRKNPETRVRWHKQHTIDICGRMRTEPFLRAILPYLRIKRALVLNALEFYQLRSGKGNKPYSIQDWKLVLKSKELTDSYSVPHIKLKERLARFIKELEKRA